MCCVCSGYIKGNLWMRRQGKYLCMREIRQYNSLTLGTIILKGAAKFKRQKKALQAPDKWMLYEPTK